MAAQVSRRDNAMRVATYPWRVQPTRLQIMAAALLVIALAAMVVAIVLLTIPPGGPPTLR